LHVAFALYKPAIIGSISIQLERSKQIRIAQKQCENACFPTCHIWTGYVKPDTFDVVNDIHILGGEGTKWKILTDYIDVGYCILSPGDVLIHFFAFIMLFYLIKATNMKFNPDYSEMTH
jgi:hypothetical protein